jgi:hypothetical protein
MDNGRIMKELKELQDAVKNVRNLKNLCNNLFFFNQAKGE